MIITSISVSATIGYLNNEYTKISGTATISENEEYDTQSAELIAKLGKLKHLSETLLNGTKPPEKSTFAPKANPVQQVAAEPTKPTFAPKANPVQQVAAEPTKPTFAPKANPVQQVAAEPTKPTFAPKANPVQQVAAEPAKPTFAPKANPAQQVAGKPKNPFAKKPEATTAQQQPTYNPITLEPLPPQELPF